ncbi:hypothetical protein JOB18_032885, partial [Solea senegalensis]
SPVLATYNGFDYNQPGVESNLCYKIWMGQLEESLERWRYALERELAEHQPWSHVHADGRTANNLKQLTRNEAAALRPEQTNDLFKRVIYEVLYFQHNKTQMMQNMKMQLCSCLKILKFWKSLSTSNVVQVSCSCLVSDGSWCHLSKVAGRRWLVPIVPRFFCRRIQNPVQHYNGLCLEELDDDCSERMASTQTLCCAALTQTCGLMCWSVLETEKHTALAIHSKRWPASVHKVQPMYITSFGSKGQRLVIPEKRESQFRPAGLYKRTQEGLRAVTGAFQCSSLRCSAVDGCEFEPFTETEAPPSATETSPRKTKFAERQERGTIRRKGLSDVGFEPGLPARNKGHTALNKLSKHRGDLHGQNFTEGFRVQKGI